MHFNVEGTIEFTSVLFIPGMAPFEQQNWAAKSRSIKLYVRRVFISDEFDEDLMPRWVDSPLPSRGRLLGESACVCVRWSLCVLRWFVWMEEGGDRGCRGTQGEDGGQSSSPAHL